MDPALAATPSTESLFAALPGAVLLSSGSDEAVSSGFVRIDASTSMPVTVDVRQEEGSSWAAVVEARAAGERWPGCTAKLSLAVQDHGDDAWGVRADIETRAGRDAPEAATARRLELHLASLVEQALRNLEASAVGPDLSSLTAPERAEAAATAHDRPRERSQERARSSVPRGWGWLAGAAGTAAVACLGVAFLRKTRARRRGVN